MRDITVNVGSATEAEPAVACALSLARRYGAFLTGLQVVPGNPPFPAAAGADAQSRRAWWEALCRGHGISGAWETPRGPYVPTLALRSLLSDVLVGSLPAGSPEAAPLIEEWSRVLLEGSAPVLLVPRGGTAEFDFRHIAIGWNGSGQALRAIHAALPLLRDAHEVTVYDGCRSGAPGAPPAPWLREWLDRHGVRFQRIDFAPGREVGRRLHDDAQARRAGLLVMGAWGRSRMSERVLGGATHWLLGDSRLPMLLAH